MILSLVMALTALTASAQFEAGKNYIGASVSGLGLSYNKESKVCFDISATAGRLLADNWMLLANVAYDYRHWAKAHSLEIGVGGRYYIEQNGLSLGLALSYGHNSDHGIKGNHGYLTPEVGYTFFLNQYVTIEPAVYYKMCFDDFANCSTVGLRIGVGFYF